MASTFIDIHGKVKFIHAVKLNKYNRWSVTIYPTPESVKLLRELKAEGLKNEFQRDDGGDYMSFHRDPEKVFLDKVRRFECPVVKDKDGKVIDGHTIGWGSDVTVRLEYYKSTPKSRYKYAACRWDSLVVHELVPFIPEVQVVDKPQPEEVKPW